MTGATLRPRLADAPGDVRDAVDALLGSPVVDERPATAGFTPSVASTVVGSGGQRLFVKVAPVGGGLGEAVEAGVVLADVVGDLGPRLVGSAAVGAWRVAAYEVVDGTALAAWDAADLEPLLGVVVRLRERLDPCPLPPSVTTPYAESFVPLLGTWGALARGPRPDGDALPRPASSVAHVRGRPLPVDVPLSLLAELESRWLATLAPGSALHHGDLRRDNVLRGPGGRLRVVDWTHLWTAPGWLDLVRLGADVAACGHDPERLLRRSCWADAPDDAVDVVLAGLAGRAWREGHLPDLPEVPGLRRMQREQGLHGLRWLEARLAARRA
ncbi:aminoglycoside phosphotransferase [Cellulomonas cellasea]|uniref:Aminoglycoside phosphotransferase domain-containing protein n=1 Tax=Cellulomonas cellasea TaxID=43670 RepID=A0A7W4UDT2_9CELL|nr:aminoglycoside phosphotransferase [Cellulomonas cellasea]MBB2922326.1 hypothetical protein [Cellulomonas cellasea]